MNEQTPVNRAIPFLAAFNDIEAYLRELLNARRSDNFRWMVDLAVRKHMLSDEHAVASLDFTYSAKY